MSVKYDVNLTYIILGLGAVIGIYLAFEAAKKPVEAAASAVGNAVNPASDQNLIYAGANKLVKFLSNGEYLDVGDWLYGVTHPIQQTQAEVQQMQQNWPPSGGSY